MTIQNRHPTGQRENRSKFLENQGSRSYFRPARGLFARFLAGSYIVYSRLMRGPKGIERQPGSARRGSASAGLRRMLREIKEKVVAKLEERALTLEGYSPDAARAYRGAVTLVAQEFAAASAQLLPIQRAAREYGWNPEALRRRIASDTQLNAGVPNRPLVSRASMEALGNGRGPRRTAMAKEPAPTSKETVAKAVESNFAVILENAVKGRRKGKAA